MVDRSLLPPATPATAPAVRPAERVNQLDGLRGVAILSVMIFHANLLPGAFFSLDIFFVLSGFLITSLLTGEYDRRDRVDLKGFYIRRMLRLLPALALFLAGVCVAAALFAPQQLRTIMRESVIAFLYLSNWARAFGIRPPELLGHTWSLSVEGQFYVLWPLLLVALLRLGVRRERMMWIALFIAAAVCLQRVHLVLDGATANRIYNGLDTRADGLMIGSALALFFSRRGLSGDAFPGLLRCLTFLSPLCVIAFACLYALARWDHPLTLLGGFSGASLMAALLIADVLLRPRAWLARLFCSRTLIATGTISYGLYLWHYPIFHELLASGQSRGAVLVYGSILTFVLAALSYRFVERPALRAMKFFAQPPSVGGSIGERLAQYRAKGLVRWER